MNLRHGSGSRRRRIRNREDIRAQVATTERIGVAMKLGASTDSVTVTADAPLLKTERVGFHSGDARL
jgi:hypothetical protein